METKGMSADEKRWRAESDAETMARYEEIMGDSARKRAAIAAAKAKANDLNRRASAMNRVASGSRVPKGKKK